ncbi:FAD-dependent monooxygenase [Streptomyces sp. NPDC042638]|uniref:FAD-dependent monooxygenase n=1 Tax=Streptomyces sp. NPDC042638 TaxID=3154333 RepID=UPI0034080E39
MRVVCVGAGPAGLYFAISAKLRDAGHEVTVLERDPWAATYGWGVVYWDDLLDVLYRNDPESAREITARSVLWQDQEVRVHGINGEQTAYFGGYGYSIGRSALLDILARRATQLGVDVQYSHHVAEPSALPPADLVVAADGANSRIRDHHKEFGTRVEVGLNPYIWLGTEQSFRSFVFSFNRTSAGWIWLHAYPSVAGISTCIVECSPHTWKALGLDLLGDDEGVQLLEGIFQRALDGHRLLSRSRGAPAHWQRFAHVTNDSWYHDTTVLLGDAAHTTHFTLGSGTRLAMIDAVVLAHSLREYPDVQGALREYDLHRRAELHPVQAAARTSMAWFEHVDQYLDRDAVAFAHAMSVRHAGQSPWHHQLHLATQITAVRGARRAFATGRRWYLARRRGDMAARQRPWDGDEGSAGSESPRSVSAPRPGAPGN